MSLGPAAQFRSGEVDLRLYLHRLCGDIEEQEPQIRALVPEPDRRARLLREAGALLERYPDPAARPPLFGVPVGVKDIFRVDGFETLCGSALPPELFAGPEASLVTRLKQAGALILGKTITTEFAYFEPGPTRNPRNLAHTPGGSSSGSAAAVAAGYCPLALGTQTVGSVIRPAAFCGVAGFKPTYGLLPLDGVIPYSPSVDHVGFFVAELGALPVALSLVAGGAPVDPPNWTAAVPEGPYLRQASPAALEAFEQQLTRLDAAGLRILRVPALEDITDITHRHQRLAAGEMAAVHQEWFPRYEASYRPRTAAWIREGRSVGEGEVAARRESRFALREALAALLERSGAQVWLCPSATGPAPEGIASTGDPAMNLPWTHAGFPAATVPAGPTANGLPLGLQLIAAAGEDAPLAAFAAWAGRVLNPSTPQTNMCLNTLHPRTPTT